MTAKGALALLLAICLCIGLCACTDAKQAIKGDDGLILWAEPSGIKYLQNDEGQIASTAAQKTVLQIQMAKNETEAVQLLLYARDAIDCYDVTVSDLICGNAVIPADSVEIFHEYYQDYVKTNQASNPDLAGGRSPDPLLPIKTAVAYGETSIEKGNNQAVLLDVTTTASTPAGIYKGQVTVTADHKTYTIPMEVKVYDIDLTGATELQTVFSTYLVDHFASAELDSSQEMHEAYVDFLLKYKMSGRLPFEGNGGPEKFVELLREYYFKDGFTAYAMYIEPTGSSYNGKASNVNLSLMKEYVRAVAYASLEDKVNYLDKAYTYFTTDVDEPASEAQFLRAKGTVDLYFEMLTDCDNELRQELAGSEDYNWYTQVVSPVLTTIPDVIPGSYDTEDIKKYGLEMLTACPCLDVIGDTGYRKVLFETMTETDIWMYTCWGPVYPYANAHSSDIPMATRVMGWMCYEMNTPAYLMYATSSYLYLEGGDTMGDPWDTGWTGQPSLGDGKITYPGAKYGIYGPCPSLRMVAYRDMSEDYQLLQILGKLYEQQGLDADVALQPLYRKIYTEIMTVIRDADALEAVRTELFETIVALQNGLDLYYSGIDMDIASATLSFKVDEGTQVALVAEGGEKTVLNADENGIYTVSVDLRQQQSVSMELTRGEQTRTVSRTLLNGLLGEIQSFEDSVSVDGWISCFGKNSVELSTDYAADGSRSAKLILNPNADDTLPYFAISRDSELIGGSWEGVESIKLRMYNPGTELLQMNVTYYVGTDVNMATFDLPAGEWITVELTMPSAVDVGGKLDSIEEIDFNFEEGTAVTVYADSFATVKEAQ